MPVPIIQKDADAMIPGDNVTLLLVEDDSSVAGSLGDFLTERGYDVDFAFNVVSGIELARHNDYAASYSATSFD